MSAEDWTMAPESLSLQEERQRVLVRRAERDRPMKLRHRAGRVLEFRWNASEDELQEAILEVYPRMDAAERAELLAVTLQVQRDERPKIDLKTPTIPEMRLDELGSSVVVQATERGWRYALRFEGLSVEDVATLDRAVDEILARREA